MFEMHRCCKCNKIVWPWQQSGLGFSVIHKKCHLEYLDAMSDDQKRYAEQELPNYRSEV